jgi:hypothetical protein
VTEAVTKVCEGCKAAITADQIVSRQAGLVRGVLLCPRCVELKRQEALAAQQAAAAEEKLDLEAHEPAKTEAPKIRSFATGSTLAGAHHESNLKRPVTAPAEPPTRVRTFHSKLTPAALAHMDDLINEWIDGHPEVYIKNVTCTVGPFEAKHVEQHLILTIYY